MLYFALVLVGAADLELVAAIGQVLLEPLGGDDLFNLGLLLAGHDSVLERDPWPRGALAAGDASACGNA